MANKTWLCWCLLAAHAVGAEGRLRKPKAGLRLTAKVSDHFAIIPTLQAPKSLERAEPSSTTRVVKRFWRCFTRAPNSW